jgi:hypothetical protein
VRWLADEEGNLAVSVELGDLGRAAGVSVSLPPAEASRAAPARVLVLAPGLTEDAASRVRREAFPVPPDVAYLGLPRGVEPPERAESVGELSLADAVFRLVRLPRPAQDILRQAPRRLEEQIGEQTVEGPGDLEGRSKWFKQRHGDDG